MDRIHAPESLHLAEHSAVHGSDGFGIVGQADCHPLIVAFKGARGVTGAEGESCEGKSYLTQHEISSTRTGTKLFASVHVETTFI
jgi:hypothetical protein